MNPARRNFLKFGGAAPAAFLTRVAGVEAAPEVIEIAQPEPVVTGSIISAADINNRFNALWNTVGSITHQIRNGYRR